MRRTAVSGPRRAARRGRSSRSYASSGAESFAKAAATRRRPDSQVMKSVKTTKAIDAGSQASSITLMMLPAKNARSTLRKSALSPYAASDGHLNREACDLTEGE